ncbi:hypothetical protein [Photobacterium phosphoreum]|uniref:hypothetical protein n=1 Tax=Photobacterium phosphoreum TaxID=659 RepID=UPI001E45CB18|nr:hypothetical protein [Photobacterium phosphoreum]MCD9471329.1 hypothetical protein [Photobacterium phosphoreum]
MLEVIGLITLLFIAYLFFSKSNYVNGMRLERNWCIANLYLDQYSEQGIELDKEQINIIVAKVHSLDVVQLVEVGKKYKAIRGQHCRPIVNSTISIGLPKDYYV